MPFKGSANFVLLQGFGWTTLAVTANLAIAMPRPHLVVLDGLLSLMGAVGLISQLCLLLSLRLFDGDDTSALDTSTSRRTPLNPPPSPWQHQLSCVMTLWSVFLYAVAAGPSLGLGDVNTAMLSKVAAVLMHCATPLAHIGAASCLPGYTAWMPFKGGMVFVLLQAKGWFLWSTSLVIHCMLVLAALRAPRRAAAFVVPHYQDLLPGLVPLSLFAQLCIVFSIRQFIAPPSSSSSSPVAVRRRSLLDSVCSRAEIVVTMSLVVAAIALAIVVDFGACVLRHCVISSASFTHLLSNKLQVVPEAPAPRKRLRKTHSSS